MTPLTGQALVDAAKAFATRAHGSQTRDDKTTLYITHPQRVAELFAYHWWADIGWAKWVERTRGEEDCYRGQALAWVHDLGEDCGVTEDDIVRETGDMELANEMTILTRGTEQPYLQYLLNLRDYSRRNDLLPLLVKLCDLEHNTSDLDGLTNAKRRKWARDKYAMARHILLA